MMHSGHGDTFSYLLGSHLLCLGCDKHYERVNQAPTVIALRCPCHAFDKALIIEFALGHTRAVIHPWCKVYRFACCLSHYRPMAQKLYFNRTWFEQKTLLTDLEKTTLTQSLVLSESLKLTSCSACEVMVKQTGQELRVLQNKTVKLQANL